MSYLNFGLLASRLGAKTHHWMIKSDGSNLVLGEVKWYGAWRKYCFFPAPNLIFDTKCLTEIIQFLDAETKAHKEKNKHELARTI